MSNETAPDDSPDDEEVVNGWTWTILEDSHGDLFFNGEVADDRRILDAGRPPSKKLGQAMQMRLAEKRGETNAVEY